MPSKVDVAGGLYTLHGDGRNFGPGSDPSKSRGYIWISVDDGKFEAHMNKTGYIAPAYFPIDGVNTGEEVTNFFDPSSQNSWSVTQGDDGSYTVSWDVVLSGPLEDVAPHINGTVTFAPDGKGGYKASGSRDGFPWAEAYYYDKDGNPHQIFQRPALRGNPEDLNAIEGNVDWTKVLYHLRDIGLNKLFYQGILQDPPEGDNFWIIP